MEAVVNFFSPQRARNDLLDELLTHQQRIFFLCLGYARDPIQAEELAQETYLKALKNIGSLKDQGAVKVWLCRVAKHTCLDYLKREKIGQEAILWADIGNIEDRSPENLALERERRQIIRSSIRKLPGKYRDVLIMREYAELSYEEIAGVLGRRIGTVMSRLNRARRLLADLVLEKKP